MQSDRYLKNTGGRRLHWCLMVATFIIVLTGDKLPINLQNILISLSLTISEILSFILPIIVFFLLASSLIQLQHTAIKLIFLLLPLMLCSAVISVMVAYLCSLYGLQHSSIVFSKLTAISLPKAYLYLPMPFSVEKAMVGAIMVSLIMLFARQKNIAHIGKLIEKAIYFLKNSALFVVQKIFIWLLPVFIAGFLIKIKREGSLALIFNRYGLELGGLFSAYVCYLCLYYFICCGCNLQKSVHAIKNMLFAGYIGMASMSSVVALPFSLRGTQKNIHSTTLTQLVIPFTINTHAVGDYLGGPTIAFLIMTSFGYALPDFATYINFVMYFLVVKFAGLPVPGGGILAVLPLLSSKFNFTAEMLSITYTLYLLCDCFFTPMNIMANGALAIMFARLTNKIKNFSVQQKDVH